MLAPIAASKTAIVLAGAGTHGSFEAGALEVLLQAGHRFGTVVGSSAGALNGSLLATATRAGQELDLASALPQTWLDHTGFWDVFTPSLSGILELSGFSTQSKLLAQVEEMASRWLPGAGAPVRLVIIVAALEGRPTEVDGRPATTYEQAITFANADFDNPQSRQPIYQAAVASGAVPLVFVPVEVPGLGPCADGGLVDNTPIKRALADPEVTRVFVVVPYPSPVDPPPPRHGLDYVAHVLDIFIQERLTRDLKDAAETNRQLAALDGLSKDLSPQILQNLRSALGFERKRQVEIVQVRPPQTLAGNQLSGFGNREKTQAQIDSGRAAARAAIGR
jgi:NTE family protein